MIIIFVFKPVIPGPFGSRLLLSKMKDFLYAACRSQGKSKRGSNFSATGGHPRIKMMSCKMFSFEESYVQKRQDLFMSASFWEEGGVSSSLRKDVLGDALI